ncbi:MAG: hypothetical protein HQL06_10215 [Nitrospirae bacterium]|nr:hypothetical protein [Nitrospirota bacterium]
MLKGEIGFSIRNASDYEDLIHHMSEGNIRPLEKDAVIIALDIVKRTINTINLVGGTQEDFNDNNSFPLHTDEDYES